MGYKRNLNSPEELEELFNEYIKTLPDIMVPQSHVHQGIIYLPVPSPATMEGFKCFLWDKGVGDIKCYIDNSHGAYSDYLPIIARIKQEIFKRNFSGASAGLYKENLIARQLGLADKQQHQVNVEQPLFNVSGNNGNK